MASWQKPNQHSVYANMYAGVYANMCAGVYANMYAGANRSLERASDASELELGNWKLPSLDTGK